ncbi:MAG TPA: biopolymer transporter ExbD [Candidatus Sumerlaeota bacterium]|nr:biopolymer transporter ExbD [Candidatus Sumerlaeota bacterium]HMX63728.1 biopolymer transporter ExbD [Candidatus Sumerlaeota bacterium]HMZ50767.1 biopolymer transporter ExbD [Candidatus Sumerlaeota bacterium]
MTRRRRDAYTALHRAGFDIVPLFAVALALAAFFLTVGGGGGASQFDVSLSGAVLPGDEKLPAVTVGADGQVRLNGRPLSLDELQVGLSTLRQQQGIDRVVVNTDPGARLQSILEAMSAIKAAGINRVAQRVQPQKSNSQ